MQAVICMIWQEVPAHLEVHLVKVLQQSFRRNGSELLYMYVPVVHEDDSPHPLPSLNNKLHADKFQDTPCLHTEASGEHTVM